MRFSTVLALSGAIALSGATAAFAGDPESCKTVRFSDIGWTDITSTTAIASKILKRTINADDQRELVRQSLEQLQSVGAGR